MTILDDRKSLLIAFLAISDQYATFIFLTKWTQRPFWMTENHLRSHFFVISCQYATFKKRNYVKHKKSFLIAFLAISYQYATLMFCLDFFFTKWPPAAILDDRKSLSIAFLAISDQYTTFIYFFTKWPPPET